MYVDDQVPVNRCRVEFDPIGMTATVLIAEDDRQVREALERILRFEGYTTVSVADGAAALAATEEHHPDLILLDMMMPFVDGVSVCKRLRAHGTTTPVLMLTARDTVQDRVSGLDAGADDYLPKPFALDELLARIRALLRRHDFRAAGSTESVFADLVVDLAGRSARRGDRAISLTKTEFDLLAWLLQRPGVVAERNELYDAVWGYGGENSKTLDVHIRELRKKLESGGEPRLVHTVHGVGYVLREPH